MHSNIGWFCFGPRLIDILSYPYINTYKQCSPSLPSPRQGLAPSLYLVIGYMRAYYRYHRRNCSCPITAWYWKWFFMPDWMVFECLVVGWRCQVYWLMLCLASDTSKVVFHPGWSIEVQTESFWTAVKSEQGDVFSSIYLKILKEFGSTLNSKVVDLCTGYILFFDIICIRADVWKILIVQNTKKLQKSAVINHGKCKWKWQYYIDCSIIIIISFGSSARRISWLEKATGILSQVMSHNRDCLKGMLL